MTTPLAWSVAAGPIVLVAAGMIGGGPADILNRRAVAAALLSFVLAVLVTASVAASGPVSTPLLGAAGIGVSLYFDTMSALMLCLVSFIGIIVLYYSCNYLDGDPQRRRFTRLLCGTLAAVLMVIEAGNLATFTAAWIATSMGLHRLLLFYPNRPAAVIAARKKFLASRLGDLCLIIAVMLIYRTFGSLQYADMFLGAQFIRLDNFASANLNIAAILLVCTGMLKSAQFPWHGWLIEVMETPTPVSALLHAGIINAGGFLVIRFSEIIALSTPSLDMLAILGGFTALFGSAVMLPQTSIKVALAYSTVAQMGFMMLECGLGAFSAAFLHILAHSLYKAHAFLSSGSVIDIARASWTPSPGGKPHPSRLVIAIVVVLFATYVVSQLFGATLAREPGVFGLGATLVLGLVHLIANGIDERPTFYVVARIGLLACLVACVYFILQLGMERVMADVLPPTQALRGPFGLAIIVMVILSFAGVTFLQAFVYQYGKTPRLQWLYATVANGLYVNTFTNRLVFKYWPDLPRTRKTLITLETGAAS